MNITHWKSDMNTCPCGSTQFFSDCCEPYLLGLNKPAQPEQLMRSRYSAYSLANIEYIQKTMQKKAAQQYDAASAREWAKSVTWLGLTVIDASTPHNNTGTVTFFARFCENHINRFIYEKSIFEKIDGDWFYTDGNTPKLMRNDPCPCGSQKKAKRCCFASASANQ